MHREDENTPGAGLRKRLAFGSPVFPLLTWANYKILNMGSLGPAQN